MTDLSWLHLHFCKTRIKSTPTRTLHFKLLQFLTSLFDVHQVDQILGDEPEVKERLFTVLKQYAAEKRVDWLASVLPDILTTDEQRQLISSIR